MKKSLTLQIPNPCEQSWNEMSKTVGGKFCSHCSTEVIDFSRMSIAQLQAYFQTAPVKVCGRINPLQLQQLNQDFGRPQATTGYRLPLVMMSFLALFTTAKATAFNTQPRIHTEFRSNKDATLATALKTQYPSAKIFLIKAQVRTENGAIPLEGVVVRIPKLNLLTTTDRNGKFELSVTGTAKQTINLHIVHLGYQNKEIAVVLGQTQTPLEINLTPEQFLMGEVTIMPLNKKPHSLKLDTSKTVILKSMLVGGIVVRKHPFSFFRRAIYKVGSWFR